MNQIVLVDCSEGVSHTIAGLLSESCVFTHQKYGDPLDLPQTRMVLMEAAGEVDADAAKVSKIRKACCFRAIPIIVIKAEAPNDVTETFLNAGATEVLALDAPPAACRQILQGHLIPNRKPLDKEMAYLTPFIENTINVLRKMASTEATFHEVIFSDVLRIFGDISGIIGLSGTSEGTVAITFYWDLARKIIANMMNVPMDKINAEYIHDGAGELINMISGSAKKQFKGTPFHFDLSLPTVVVGSGHQLGHPEGASIAVLIFDVGQESFILQVCLKPNKNGASR